MVNVNISEDAWRRVRYYTQPGESFADTLDRVLQDYHHRGEMIGELDEKGLLKEGKEVRRDG